MQTATLSADVKTNIEFLMSQYHIFHLELLQQAYNQLLTHYPFNAQELMPQDQEFLDSYLRVIDTVEKFSDGYIESGQTFCSTWIRGYSDLAPLLPRDLLWFFGGDCLHFMPDDEIAKFQLLDELRYAAQSNDQDFDYPKQRAEIFKLTH